MGLRAETYDSTALSWVVWKTEYHHNVKPVIKNRVREKRRLKNKIHWLVCGPRTRYDKRHGITTHTEPDGA